MARSARRSSRDSRLDRASASRPAPATASEPAQALRGAGQRVVVLGEAETDDARVRRRLVERRYRDRRDAGFADQPLGEVEVVLVADRRIVDELEIRALDRQHPEFRSGEQRAEMIALAL